MQADDTVDPLRKRPTTFSRSTVDPSASSGADRSWTETPAERRQRIEDEMAGIKRSDPAKAKKQTQESDYGTKRRRDDEIRAEVERYSVCLDACDYMPGVVSDLGRVSAVVASH